MKKYLIIIALSLTAHSTVYAQTVDDIGKIALGVKIEESSSDETRTFRNIIEDKLVKFASQSGYSSFGSGNFNISPNIVINNIDVAEGGMKNVYVARGDIYLTIVDANNGTVFSSVSYPLKGSATKKELAIKNAILNVNYENVSKVFEAAKAKILSYYEAHIDSYFANADASVANGNYDEAITWLMMIPDELTSLHGKAMEKAQIVYNQRDEAIRQQMLEEQRIANNKVLTTANSLLAMHQPQDALKTLWNYQQGENVDQNKQYAALVRKAEQQVSAEEREAMRKEEREYQDNRRREDRAWSEYKKDAQHRRNMDKADVAYRNNKLAASERVAHHQLSNERQRVNALKNVACEYLRNNPNRVDCFRIRF